MLAMSSREFTEATMALSFFSSSARTMKIERDEVNDRTNIDIKTDIADSFVAAGLDAPDLPATDWDPYAEPDAARLTAAAAAVTLGVNHVNRAMGLPDLYPFVMSDTARAKLAFVHHWLRRGVREA